jgi:hypothetical protein
VPNRIPISTAKRVAKDHDLQQIILVAWDGTLMHVVTYGKSVKDCDQAAQGGNRVKAALGWPEILQSAEPSRVTKLRALLKEGVDLARDSNAPVHAWELWIRRAKAGQAG